MLVVGAGLMGRWHAATARQLGARILAIVDPNPAAAGRLARTLPNVPTARTLDELPVGDLQGVIAHLCTPLATHVDVGLELISAKSHVLIEKPMTTVASETEALLAAANENAVQICPVHQYAFQRGVAAAEQARSSLGEPLRIHVDIASAGAEGRPDWRQALVAEILPHPFSIIQRLKPQTRLSRLSWSKVEPAPGELALLAADETTTFSISISTRSRPTRFMTSVSFASETVEIDGFHGSFVRLRGQHSRLSKAAGPFDRALKTLGTTSANLTRRMVTRELAYPGLRELTRRFYACVLSGAAAPISLAQIRDLALARDKVCGLHMTSAAGCR